MQCSEAYNWLLKGERRQTILLGLHQPMTANHLVHRIGLGLDDCMTALRELSLYQLVTCLTPAARSSRVYWLTDLGIACQRKLSVAKQRPVPLHDFPQVDWSLYGWVCFRHRAIIIRTLTEPMQPAVIKRRARSRHPGLRMSANNVRDVIYLFVRKGIALGVCIRRRSHCRYELTETGKKLQLLLNRAEMPAAFSG